MEVRTRVALEILFAPHSLNALADTTTTFTRKGFLSFFAPRTGGSFEHVRPTPPPQSRIDIRFLLNGTL